MDNQMVIADLYNQSIMELEDGQIVKGTIVNVGPREVLVDVGYKSEGVIPLSEFIAPEDVKLGDEIEVYVESKEDDHGMIILSRDKAERLKGWNSIKDEYKEGDLIEGTVRRKVKGGYIINIFDTECFLPASLSGFKGVSEKDVIGNAFKFKILKMNIARHSLVLSRRDVMRMEREGARAKIWETLKVGEVYPGVVKGITDFGAFVDLGGIDGLLHIVDMSWSRISHPSEMVALGDKIEVKVLNLDKAASKVSLGLKQCKSDPWQDIETKFPAGSRIKGKVVNIMNYGVFVELEKGIEGLIHISEVSWQKRVHDIRGIFAIGDIVEVYVMSINKQGRRISLSVKQLESNPWLGAEKKFPVGSKVSGKVKGWTDYGAFVELDANLEGMIHISDMSWTKKIGHPQDILRKGQKVDVVILSVNGKNQRIALGLKQAIINPWPEIAERYAIGMELESEVIQINNFGIFVRLSEDLEGLVYASEIDSAKMSGFNPGDKLKVKIIKVDVEQGKIGLGLAA